MKKSLILALWCGLCVCASAAFQYEVIKGPLVGTGGNAINGHSFTIKITEGSGSIYILDKISSLYGGNNELLALKANMTVGNYGYVDKTGNVTKADGSKITTYEKQMNQHNPVVTQTGYKIGDFQVGDEIGIWLTNTKGNTGASILDKSVPINSKQMSYRDAYVGKDALDNSMFQLDFKNTGSIHFGIYGVASSAPTGKPLPGVFATLLLGGGALGALGMRKKRVKKA